MVLTVAPNPRSMSAITWSSRMRMRCGSIWVGRCRLPRCQATRQRSAGSAVISMTASGASCTAIQPPSSRASPSPATSTWARWRSSRKSSPWSLVSFNRRRWRWSKSSVTVPLALSLGQLPGFSIWVMRCMVRRGSNAGPWEAPWRGRRSEAHRPRAPRKFRDRPRSGAGRRYGSCSISRCHPACSLPPASAA